MSYCRWSSNNWDCDVYCYEHVDGYYATHVATNRIVGPIPREPSFSDPLDEVWLEQYNAVHDFIKTAKREPIGLAHDGETFESETLFEFLDVLKTLHAEGYHIPQYVFDDVSKEIEESLDNPPSAL